MEKCICCNAQLSGRRVKYCSDKCRKKYDYKTMDKLEKKELINKKIINRKKPNWQPLKDITIEQAAIYAERRSNKIKFIK